MRISHTVWGIIVAAAFASGAFLASPELRAYAADTVFSTDIVDGEVKSVDIGTGEVKTADIGTGEVKAVDIGAAAVTSPKIGTGAVTNAKIATGAVDSSKILDGSIVEADIADGAVTGSKLGANSIDSSKIVDNSVSSADILDDTITTADLATDSVGASELNMVSKLSFGTCYIDPPDIDGTDDANNGRKLVVSSCSLPDETLRVIAYPSYLAEGLVPCGSYVPSSDVLVVCIQNVFDQTNVDDAARLWFYIAFT